LVRFRLAPVELDLELHMGLGREWMDLCRSRAVQSCPVQYRPVSVWWEAVKAEPGCPRSRPRPPSLTSTSPVSSFSSPTVATGYVDAMPGRGASRFVRSVPLPTSSMIHPKLPMLLFLNPTLLSACACSASSLCALRRVGFRFFSLPRLIARFWSWLLLPNFS
jgi:hypothetical protein